MPGAGVGTRLNAIFDLAKRWQRAKAARKGLGPWWNVLRAGFETFYNCALFRPGKALAMGCRGVLRAARDGFVTDVDRRKGMRRQT